MTKKWLLLAAALSSTAALAAPIQFSKQVPVGAGDRVNVSNVAGDVTITTWDRREVDVQGELGVAVDHVDVKQETGNIDIRVVLKERSWLDRNSWRDTEARLEITLPADVQIDVNTVSAPITVSGVTGKMRLKSVSGDLRSSALGDDLDAKTVSGNIELTGSKAHANVRASTVSGNVNLVQAGGDIDARSTSGNLGIDSKGSGDLRARTVSGDIWVRGVLAGDADLELQSVSGRVKVAAQAPGGYRYDVTSFSGGVRNCFGYDVQKSEGFGGQRLGGVRGEGKGNLRIQSHSGSVELCDH